MMTRLEFGETLNEIAGWKLISVASILILDGLLGPKFLLTCFVGSSTVAVWNTNWKRKPLQEERYTLSYIPCVFHEACIT